MPQEDRIFAAMATAKPKAVFCWSGGKDSSYCLYKVLQEQLYDVRYLLTTIHGEYRRVSMHGVHEKLAEQQALSIGIPMLKVEVYEGSNTEYERQMEAALTVAKQEGVSHVIFGDIFLEDLRRYREEKLTAAGMTAVFPLWQYNTSALLQDFIHKGFKTVLCCVNDAYLDNSWAGREIDYAFAAALPDNVDPCGENGEFHTFCYDGPLFTTPIQVRQGDIVYKPLTGADLAETGTRGFWYCDLLPM